MLGLLASVMNGRFTDVSSCRESSHLAFSAASLRRCRHRVVADVDALGLAELLGDVVDEYLVVVVAAEVGVAVGGQHLEDAVIDVEDRDVERTTAEVEDRDLEFVFFEPVGQGVGGRLVDDPLDLQAGDLASILGRPTLRR